MAEYLSCGTCMSGRKPLERSGIVAGSGTQIQMFRRLGKTPNAALPSINPGPISVQAAPAWKVGSNNELSLPPSCKPAANAKTIGHPREL